MTAYCYLVHGLVLHSTVRLPIPESAQAEPDVVYSVGLDDLTLGEPMHRRSDHDDDPWAIEQWFEDRLVVEFPDWATFSVARGEVTLLRAESNDAALVAHLLLDHILPRVVSLRGDLMLHAAGAVGPSGRAHIFLGRTGMGKSTLATSLVAGGWALLDDDGIRVMRDERGPLAVPGYPGVRLLPDTAEAVLPGLPAGEAMARGHAKRRFDVDGTTLRMAPEPAPIAAVYLLERVDRADAELERLSAGEAVGVLAEHAFHLADEPRSITRRAFEQTTAVAAAVPVYRLQHPQGLGRLDGSTALIGRLDVV